MDFPLQSEYMLGKLSRNDWRMPLTWHSGYHAFGTFLVIFPLYGVGIAFKLSVIDFVLHFIIDRIKAMYNIIVSPGINDPRFWNALGADQMAHQLTMLYLVYLLY